MLNTSISVMGQTVVGKITRPGMKPWSLAVYEKGNKVFIGDKETGNLLIYDGTSLELLNELSIDGGCGGSSFCIHEESGKLYFCTFPSGNHVAVVDADADTLLYYIDIDGYVPIIDEELGQIYIKGRLAPFELYVIDVETEDVDTVSLSNVGLTSGSAVNPVTHEVFVGYLQGEGLDIIDGLTLERSSVSGINGRGMVVNWLENKIYRELGTFEGTWIYYVDDGSSETINHGNDAEPSVFDPISNEIFTTSEVENRITVIDGKTDNYIHIPFPSFALSPAVSYCTNNIYFAGTKSIYILNGGTKNLIEIPVENPIPSGGVVTDIKINQSNNYVYVINDGSALDFVTVIKDFVESKKTVPLCAGDSVFVQGEYQTNSGTYYDTLQTVIGCDSVIITELIVHPVYEITREETICEGESIILGGEPQTTSGTYYDTLQTVIGCDSVIITKLIINERPYIYLGNDTTISTNDTIILDAGSGFSEYLWNTGSIEQVLTLSNLNVGDYEYFVWVTDFNNCVGSDTIIIHAVLPNLVTNEIASFDLEIFPNPTSDFLYIRPQINIDTKTTITLIDNLGKVAYEHKIEKLNASNVMELNLTNLKNGFYILRINGTDLVYINKIIKY